MCIPTVKNQPIPVDNLVIMMGRKTQPASHNTHRLHSYTGYTFTWAKKTSLTAQTGVQLIELIIALAIVAIIVVVAVPSYTQYIDKANNAAAATDVSLIEQAIERFYAGNNRYPDNLTEMGFNAVRDPWGNAYQYLRIAGAGLKGKGALRKDKKLNPVNSDYDLYSMGKDGQSRLPFTAKPSWDDVVRANNGRYIGLAADY